jgi:hypothetical protein
VRTSMQRRIAALIVVCISLHAVGGDAGITPETAGKMASGVGGSAVRRQLSKLAAGGGADRARTVCAGTLLQRPVEPPSLASHSRFIQGKGFSPNIMSLLPHITAPQEQHGEENQTVHHRQCVSREAGPLRRCDICSARTTFQTASRPC